MAVRIKDIAAQLGVSDATVSLALSGSPRISAPTRDRVLAAASELGYRPNTAARALRTESTKALGLIVSDVSNPFFGELAGEIERQAGAAGYAVMLCNSDEDTERQDEYLRELLVGRRADGVILVPTSASTAALRSAAATKAKLVILDRPLTVPGSGEVATYLRGLPTVRSDAGAALREAAEMLVALGHRRFGIVAPPQATPLGRERRTEIRDALIGAGAPARAVVVEEGDFREGSGHRATTALLQRRNRPTAILAADGLMGVGALKAARDLGLRVPYDLSVLCFDDEPWFDLFDPPLTAIAQPIRALADAAVDAFLGLVSGTGVPGLEHRPPCTLMRRSSCGLPPR